MSARVKAFDAFTITGRGTVVSVDVAETNGMGRGDEVQFDLPLWGYGKPGLITAEATYRVLGVEESRCLVYHGDGRQCVTGRCLVVREMEQQ